MSFALGLLPELVSIVAGVISSLTFLRARKVVRNYSLVMAQLEKIESLEKAHAELSELRLSIEQDPEESLADEEAIESFVYRLGEVISADTDRLDSVGDLFKSINVMLDDQSKKYTQEQVDEMKRQSAYVDELLQRRKTLIGQITEDLSTIRQIVGGLDLSRVKP